MQVETGRQRRVARSHGVAASALRLGAIFMAWAAIWGVLRAIGGEGTWWGPLHAFMAGTVLLAISGATQLFSTTWSASVPADPRLAAAQRWSLAVGALLAVLGVANEVDWMTISGATLVGIGLVALGWILVGIVRRSLLRRFDLASRFYLLALASGAVGVTLGGIIGSGVGGSSYLDLRTAHMHLNLVGLVGFSILGTLPTLLPTTARHKLVSGKEAVAAFWLCVGAFALFTAGIVSGPAVVGIGCILVGAAAALILGGIVSRLGIARLLRGGLPALLILSGSLWLTGWVGHEAYTLLAEGHLLYARATAVGAAGVGLVLFGSLAYLVPVLAGPGERLTANFARMHGQGAMRSVVANAVPVLLALGVRSEVPVALAALFLVDYLVRVVLVLTVGRRGAATTP
ncbi:MAG: hypothetical protein QY307_03300 [Acidimicrobiia bacterium]|nr:MAG: hypothetical protein QY307_03300 [Acidimicrobiia bacterium]